MKGGPSGGTLSTIENMIKNPVPKKTKLGFDPLLLVPGKNEKTSNKFITNNVMWPEFIPEILCWTTISPLAGGNACVVKRSNTLLNYGSRVNYKEGSKTMDLFWAIDIVFMLTTFFIAFLCRPIRWCLWKWVLPNPGQGPSDEAMDAGFL